MCQLAGKGNDRAALGSAEQGSLPVCYGDTRPARAVAAGANLGGARLGAGFLPPGMLDCGAAGGCAMGGMGSGRWGGRPTADASCKIDFAWMLRERLAVPGSMRSGNLNWTRGGDPSGSISYTADMIDCDNATLILNYSRGEGDKREQVQQRVRLTYTEPRYGGRRWWMTCPFRWHRAAKLYLPPGGDRFASRNAWRLGYQSQRLAHRDRAFEAMFRLQKKLGGTAGFDCRLRRPKGMWRRTFDRHWQRYLALDAICNVEMSGILKRLTAR